MFVLDKQAAIKESFLNLGFSACYTREREVSATVLDSSLAQLNIDNIERVKKNSFRIILNENYVSYSKALIKLDMDSLSDIRQQFCLNVVLKCVENLQIKLMLQHANNERLKNSPMIYMQNLLNLHCINANKPPSPTTHLHSTKI